MTEHWKFSRMRRNEPVTLEKKDKDEAGDPRIEIPDMGGALKKRIESQTIQQLFGIVVGLPDRVRQFIRRVRKLESKGTTGESLAEETAPLAKKILDDRIEVAVIVPARMVYDSEHGRKEGLTDEQMLRMTDAVRECDALLTLTAYYFLPGVSLEISMLVQKMAEHPIMRSQVAGVYSVVNYGAFSKARRSSRQGISRELLKQEGWAPPEVEEK